MILEKSGLFLCILNAVNAVLRVSWTEKIPFLPCGAFLL